LTTPACDPGLSDRCPQRPATRRTAVTASIVGPAQPTDRRSTDRRATVEPDVSPPQRREPPDEHQPDADWDGLDRAVERCSTHGTDHRALHPPVSRASTVAEANGRSLLFLSAVSGATVALALVAQTPSWPYPLRTAGTAGARSDQLRPAGRPRRSRRVLRPCHRTHPELLLHDRSGGQVLLAAACRR
jgi:hypothetical protein